MVRFTLGVLGFAMVHFAFVQPAIQQYQEFHFGDRVIVADGFYKGQRGQVRQKGFFVPFIGPTYRVDIGRPLYEQFSSTQLVREPVCKDYCQRTSAATAETWQNWRTYGSAFQ